MLQMDGSRVRLEVFFLTGSDLLDVYVYVLFFFSAIITRRVPGRGACDCPVRGPLGIRLGTGVV